MLSHPRTTKLFLHGKSHKQQSSFAELSYSELTDLLINPSIGPKADAAIFAPFAGVDGKQKTDAQNALFNALIVDHDEGDLSESELRSLYNGYGVHYSYFSTSSHQQFKSGAKENRWKVVIPFSQSCVASDYHSLAKGLAYHLGTDIAQTNITQICYLPNKLEDEAPYAFYIHDVEVFLNPADIDHPLIKDAQAALQAHQQESEREQAEAKAAVAAPVRKHGAQPLQPGQISVIDSVNQYCDIKVILLRNDYREDKRSGKYRCPRSTSGTAGVWIAEDGSRCYSHHGNSDPLADGYAHDAFDTSLILEHGGNLSAALRHWGSFLQTGSGETITQHNQRQYMQQQDAQRPDYNAPVSDDTMNAPATDANFWAYSDGTNAAYDYPEAANDTQQQSVASSQPQANQGDQKPVFSLDLDSARLTPDWLDVEPPARVMLVDGFLPAGITGILAAAGGTGKSMLALQLAAALTGGEYFYDMPITENGPVLVLSAEDEREECQRRLYSMKQNAPRHLQSWNIDWGKVTDNLLIKDLVGTPLLFTSSDAGGTARITAAVHAMAAELKEHLAGLKLIVVDTYSRFNGGKENANEDAAMFVKACEMLSKETGATVLIAAHTRKSSEGKADDIGGGARFVDSSRWAATLHRYINDDEADKLGMEPDEAARYIRLKVVKDNYCGKQGTAIFLKRAAGGTLVESEQIRKPDSRAEGTERKHEAEYQTFMPEALRIIQRDEAAGRPLTVSKIATSHGGADNTFGLNREKVRMFTQRLISDGHVMERKNTGGRGYTLHVVNLPQAQGAA